MKTKLIYSFLLLTFILTACGESKIDADLRAEVDKMKAMCPMDQGNGVVITDVNFHQSQKVLEYRCSIEGIYSIDDSVKDLMKAGILNALENEVSITEGMSIKMLLAEGYILHYIYTDTSDKVLCEIQITKDDLA